MNPRPPHAQASFRVARVERPSPAEPGPPSRVRVRRVLGDHPLAQVGVPRSTAVDEQRGLIAVGGRTGWLSWSGARLHRAVSQLSVTSAEKEQLAWTTHRVGVYERDSLRCLLLAYSAFPVNALAFHPTQPLLAVGTGCYDGGFAFRGELLLIHLDSGEIVSALGESREVRTVVWRRWRHGRVLDLGLAPYSDEELDREAHTVGFDAVVERADWLAVRPGGIEWRELDGPLRGNARTETEETAVKTVHRWCAAAGAPWERRREVWAVQPLPDGRVLASLDGVRLEAWQPDGTRAWAVGAGAGEGGGRQIHRTADGRSAWVTVPGAADRPIREQGAAPWSIVRYELEDGRVLDQVEPGFPAVVAARADGWTALCDVTMDPRAAPVALFAPGDPHHPAGRLEWGEFEPFAHDFPVARATRIYLLMRESEPRRPASPRGYGRFWVVAVEPEPQGTAAVRRLFPLNPRAAAEGVSAQDGAPVHEARAVQLSGAAGDALVCSGSDASAYGAYRAFITRRELPDGALTWRVTVGAAITTLESDEAGRTVFAALASGDLLALDAATGRVRWQLPLEVDGWPTIGMSLASAAPNRLLVGTAHGQIVDLDLAEPVR